MNSQALISLLPFNRVDYDLLIAWVTDEAMLMQFAGPHFHFPLTAEQLDVSFADKKRTAYTVLHLPDKTIIDHAEIVLLAVSIRSAPAFQT